MMRNWSELKYDVLGEIVLKLAAIEDFVYFSVVCRSWNRASSMVKYIWKPSMPWLLLTENDNEKPYFLWKVYSLNSDKYYQLRLPHTFEVRCWGSAYGWIVTNGEPIYLKNPLTKARIRLPRQPTSWYEDKSIINDDILNQYYQQISIRKVIIVHDVESGNNGDGLIVFAMYTDPRRLLVFARPGDLTWTSVVSPRHINYRAVDVVCKDRLVLILYEDASVGYVDLSDLSTSTNLEQQSVRAKKFLPSPKAFKGRLSDLDLPEMYLVESFCSLLMVLRHKGTIWDPNSQVRLDEGYKTVGFEVFGIDFKTKSWDRVKNLGDVALFVGNNQSISVRASDCRNCKSDCIYFTDDCDEVWTTPPLLGGHDMGFYDLEDGKIYQFYGGDDVHSDYCNPFWFVPHF